MLGQAAENGNWIFLANCHLSIPLLPELESMIDALFKKEIHQDFRLVLSANSHPNFSISLLQRSIKVSQEPPKGIKAKMLKIYGSKNEFTAVEEDRYFRKAVYGLCWFHSILIERKKFKNLGWNVTYAFNDSDYAVCEDLIAIYMGVLTDGKTDEQTYKRKEEIPWQAIQYLIAEANYGGRVTDDYDRRLIKVYAKEIFNQNVIQPEKWRPYGTEELNYAYPADEMAIKHPTPSEIFTPAFFYEQVANQLEDNDPPLAFGQHINAEISSQIMDSNDLLSSILALTPQKSGDGGGTDNSGQVKLIQDLADGLPEIIDLY